MFEEDELLSGLPALESDNAQYNAFIRKVGVRRFSNLLNPKHFDMISEILPKRPTLHHLPVTLGDNELGIEPNNQILFLLNKQGEIENLKVEPYVLNVLEATKDRKGFLGNPKEAMASNKAYFSRYPQFNRVYNRESAFKYVNPIFVNYGLLDNIYPERVRSPYMALFRTQDILKCFVREINDHSINSLREQYLYIKIPDILPAMEDFKILMKKPTLVLLREIKSPNDLYFLHLASLFINGEESDFAGNPNPLLNLSKEAIERLTLITYEDKLFSAVKFSDLMEWSKDKSYDQKIIAFYRWFESFVEKRTGVVAAGEDDEPEDFGQYDESIAEVKAKRKDVIESDFKSGVINQVNDLAESGRLSAKEYKYLLKQADKFETLPNPFTGDGKLVDLLEVPMKEVEQVPTGTIPDMETITDKSYLVNRISNYDSAYLETRLDADIARSVMWMQKAGLPITNFKVTPIQDAANNMRKFTVQTAPADGQTTTFSFTIPVVDEEGTFMVNGVRSRLDPQAADQPIRKTAPDEVSLTSAASKFFVRRSDKAIADYDKALKETIGGLIVMENSPLTDVKVGKCFDNYLDLPKTYSTIAMRFKQFKYKDVLFVFDYHNRSKLLGIDEKELKRLERNGGVVVGLSGKDPVLMDKESYITKMGDKEVFLGEVEDYLEIDRSKIPVPFAEATLHGRKVPVILVLAYLNGLEKTLDKLGIRYRVEPKNARTIIEADETLVTLKDSKLIIKDSNARNRLLVGGLVSYKTSLKEVSLVDLNTKGGYIQPFSSHRIGNGQMRKYERFSELWVDPITEILLTRMGEPTNWEQLLVRASELLTTDYHPDENDSEFMVDKHYSRMVELLYRELFKGVEDYKNNRVRSKAKMTINPKAVQIAITTDSAITQINDINPMMSAKERERITFGGTGGRSSRTMTAKARQFHKSDIGRVSEGGVDSGKVGTVFWTSANPKYDTLYGTTKKFDLNEDGKSSVISPTALTMPFSTYNDPKRAMFAGIQIAHWINSEGLELMSARTPFDTTIAHRVGKLYAFPAKEDGKISKLTDDIIVVNYASGKTESCKLGKQFGNSTGKTMIHHVICDLKVNAKFKKGDILAFNKLFFKRDWFNPTQVAIMMGVSARVALKETLDTYEDGCALSAKLSKQLASTTTKTKDILANFDNEIVNLVKVGDVVNYNTPLCVIKEGYGGLGETKGVNLEGLQQLGDGVPLAKMEGTIEAIEVLYCGDIEVASESVNKIIKVDNRRRKQLNADDPTIHVSGEILEPTFIANNYVGKENVLIRIRITHKDDMVTGDKVVFDGPLKSVPGAIFTTPIRTFRGEEINAKFSYAGILNRIVLSPVYTGVLNLIMYQIGKNAIAVGYGEEPAEPITESY